MFLRRTTDTLGNYSRINRFAKLIYSIKPTGLQGESESSFLFLADRILQSGILKMHFLSETSIISCLLILA
ncbi:hypothetical protein LCGC14_0606090 [marine sediment metagenome]|uniref:Uncharacterized protein n=1 Tax=marine sediment metagenome TaxID=412755 RepID=A0A0F9RT59_9ZZZZ